MKDMIPAGNYSFGNNFEIFDNLIEGVSVYEPVYYSNEKIQDFIIKYVNPATIRDLGNSRSYYIGKYVSVLYGPENLETYVKIFEDIIVTGKNKTFKAQLPPLNRYYQISAFTTPEGFLIMLNIDITQQEKTEREFKKAYNNLEIKVHEKTDELQKTNEELKREIQEKKWIKSTLKENEKKFRLIFNKADDMISLNLVNEDLTSGKFIEVNETGIKRLGYSREEFLNMNPYDIDKEYETHELLSKPTENRHVTFETVHTTKDLRKIPVEVSAHLINFNGKKVGLSISRDISERKKAEELLNESKNRYRKLLENCFDAVVIHNKGKIISANSSAMKLLGVKTHEELLNIPLIDFVHPDYKEKVAERIKEMATGKAVSPIEEKFLSLDGKTIDVEVLATGFTSNGENAVQAVFRDISKRKKVEKDLKDLTILQANIMKDLKENEEKFRLIFNNADDMISLSEINENEMPGKYIEINEVGCEQLGYTREELLNMTPVDIVAPDKRAEMPENASTMEKNGFSNFEIDHMTKDGKRIPVEINGHRIKYNGKETYLTVSRDITIRKQMAEALKESEEKFREIFNNANDMITLHEMNENGMPGKFIEVNEVGCKRLGYTNKEFQNMAPVDIIAPDKRVEMANHAVELWTNGYAKFEIIHVAKDDKRIPVEINTHIFKFNGETVALGISRDITERKESEEKLNELLNKLSHLNEEFEQCIHITSNYLQEHLGTITDITKQLKNNYKVRLDINAENLIESIADESEHLKHIMTNLLEYENISRTKIKLKSVDTEKLLNKALLNLNIAEKDAAITYDHLPQVTADPRQVLKVFQSLINNALDFKRENKTLKIHISAKGEQNAYVFSVQDNGTGIDSLSIKNIFSIYHHFSGHGITRTCLSPAQKIIENHGGKIWVESEPGTGSTFYFSIPKPPVPSK
jgi:PAS domain S-box